MFKIGDCYMEKIKKNKKHGKLIKCNNCHSKMDIEEERLNGNWVTECGVTILYCNCGNEIVVK